MKRKILIASILLLLIVSYVCIHYKGKQPPHISFETDLLIPTTPIKNQEDWGIGWTCATLSLLESERILAGDSLQLSVTYLARTLCLECAQSHKDSIEFSHSLSYCFHLLEKYGIIPFDFYNKHLPISARKFQKIYQQHTDSRQSLFPLDTIFPSPPSYISFYHAPYTPQEMLHSVLKENSYEVFSPIPPFSLPQDMKREHTHYLSPKNTIPFIQKTLRNKHSLIWYGDTLHNGYSSSQGTAFAVEEPITHSSFTSKSLHALHIIGIAHIKEGESPQQDKSSLYFIAKDSHGKSNKFKGYIYISENYIKRYTLALYRIKNGGVSQTI